MAARKTPNPSIKGERAGTEADAILVLSHIEDEGKSFNESCRLVGVNKGSMWTLIHGSPTLDSRYMRARAIRGTMFGERVADIGDRVLSGEVPPDAARVAIDALKWSAARMAPKVYGDKVQTEVTGANGGPIKIDPSRISDADLDVMLAIVAKGQIAIT